ncbi:MAG: hypothetical protein BWY66_00628 [bacterium ADurb.Bin374]|nr:MAG: hypothetical protein BWY66_00628 [bacterium ADurb.Bin374]
MLDADLEAFANLDAEIPVLAIDPRAGARASKSGKIERERAVDRRRLAFHRDSQLDLVHPPGVEPDVELLLPVGRRVADPACDVGPVHLDHVGSCRDLEEKFAGRVLVDLKADQVVRRDDAFRHREENLVIDGDTRNAGNDGNRFRRRFLLLVRYRRLVAPLGGDHRSRLKDGCHKGRTTGIGDSGDDAGSDFDGLVRAVNDEVHDGRSVGGHRQLKTVNRCVHTGFGRQILDQFGFDQDRAFPIRQNDRPLVAERERGDILDRLRQRLLDRALGHRDVVLELLAGDEVRALGADPLGFGCQEGRNSVDRDGFHAHPLRRELDLFEAFSEQHGFEFQRDIDTVLRHSRRIRRIHVGHAQRRIPP